jgi:hypothetical protein
LPPDLVACEEADLGFKHNPCSGPYSRDHDLHERADVGGAGVAGVEDEVGVLRGDDGTAVAESFEAGCLGRARRGGVSAVAEDGACASSRRFWRVVARPPGEVRLDVCAEERVRGGPQAEGGVRG